MAAKSTQNTVENLIKSSKEQLESVVTASTQTAQKGFEQSVETTKKQMDEMIKNYDEVASIGRENIDACVAASTSASKAIESLSSELFAFSKKTCEANLAAFKALTAAKTPKEFFDIQSDLVKGRYEEAVTEANKVNAAMTAAANDMMAPLNSIFAANLEKFSKTVAR